MEYGIIAKLENGHDLWFEPVHDELDAFVIRDEDGYMVKIFIEDLSDNFKRTE